MAKMRHAGVSARIERCRSENVDYERAESYIAIVAALHMGMDPSVQFHVVLDDVTYNVKIVIGNTCLGNTSLDNASLDVAPPRHDCRVSAPVCPLCLGVHHRLRFCPHLPDELRPFV